MRKAMCFGFILVLLFFSLPIKGISDTEEKIEYQVIPDEAIRLRILAHSDSEDDQRIKHQVRDAVNAEISEWVQDMTDIDEARELIAQRVPDIEKTVADVLDTAGENKEFSVEYDSHVTFPVKVYGSYLYPAGEYEAVLITIGAGQGSNWWCVLFPPLCFLDFSAGTSVAEETDEATTDESEKTAEKEDDDSVEVKFFLFEWLGWS